jgi:FKBP-type peptidyl-prolyl cis-trans isomerase
MKKQSLLIAAAVGASVAVFAIARQPADAPTTAPAAGTAEIAPPAKPAPTTQESLARFSYGLGFYQIGKQMKEAEVQLDVGLLSQGVQDALNGTNAKYTEDELRDAGEVLQKMVAERMEAKEKEAGAKAESEGKAFLEANKAKPGVKTTASGLQFEITKEGTGATPKPTDTVKVHYTGTLIDGTKFDSSVDRGEPAEFPLDRVIPGWTEGLQLLKVGGKAHLVIPSALGYGERGYPPKIPGNSTLVFDVELLEIVPATTEPAMPAAPQQP